MKVQMPKIVLHTQKSVSAVELGALQDPQNSQWVSRLLFTYCMLHANFSIALTSVVPSAVSP